MVIPGDGSLHHRVAAIRTVEAVACVVQGVSVAARPLEVDVVALLHLQTIRCEVIFHRWIHLHDVTTLTAHLQVMDGGIRGNVGRSWSDGESVGTILEGAP